MLRTTFTATLSAFSLYKIIVVNLSPMKQKLPKYGGLSLIIYL